MLALGLEIHECWAQFPKHVHMSGSPSLSLYIYIYILAAHPLVWCGTKRLIRPPRFVAAFRFPARLPAANPLPAVRERLIRYSRGSKRLIRSRFVSAYPRFGAANPLHGSERFIR